MKCKPIELDLPDGKIAGLEWNAKCQHKALLLHGWLDNLESFHLLAPELAKSYHVVAIDWSGHGKSFHKPGTYGYRHPDFLLDLHFILSELGWKTVDFFGHSMGGALANVYSCIFPEKVGNLYLFDTFLPLSSKAEEVVSRYRDYIMTAKKFSKKQPRCFKNKNEAVELRHQATPDLPWDSCVRIVERNLCENKEEGFTWSFDEKLKLPTPLRLSFDHLQIFNQKLERPCKIFLGRESPYQSWHPEILQAAKYNRQIECVEVPGGHYPHIEAVDIILKNVVSPN